MPSPSFAGQPQLKLSDQLISDLDMYSPGVSHAQAANIEEILNDILNMLSALVAPGASLSEVNAGQMLTIGSSQLGVLQPADKVSAVYVGPLDVQLWDLRTKFCESLERSPDVVGVSSV